MKNSTVLIKQYEIGRKPISTHKQLFDIRSYEPAQLERFEMTARMTRMSTILVCLAMLTAIPLMAGCDLNQGTKTAQKSSRWYVLKEKSQLSKIMESKVFSIRRDDGFTMRKIGGNQKFEIFLCEGNFGQLAFYASRQDEFEPFDTYLVNTTMIPNHKELKLNPETNESLIQSHAKDIEFALLHFPTDQMFDDKPVKKVLFQLEPPLVNGQVNTRSQLVQADDVGTVRKAGTSIKLRSSLDQRLAQFPKKNGFYPVSREGYFYVEGERTALIGTDLLVGGVLIYTTNINWLPPHEDEPMTKTKRAEIIAQLEQWLTDNQIHYRLK